jgi:hypothetical protein
MDNQLISYHGTCHCKQLKVTFKSKRPPVELPYRQCECSYCTAIAPIYISDTSGQVDWHISKIGSIVGRYQFAMKTADFIFCKSCGSYLGALQANDKGLLSVINVKYFSELLPYVNAVKFLNLDRETPNERSVRRAKHWTPSHIL